MILLQRNDCYAVVWTYKCIKPTIYNSSTKIKIKFIALKTKFKVLKTKFIALKSRKAKSDLKTLDINL